MRYRTTFMAVALSLYVWIAMAESVLSDDRGPVLEAAYSQRRPKYLGLNNPIWVPTVVGMQLLDVTKEEIAEFNMLYSKHEEANKDVEDLWMPYLRASDWDPAGYHKDLLKHEKRIRSYNRDAFEVADRVLKSSRRRTRFRQLNTQTLLRTMDFEAIARIHEVDLDWETFQRVEHDRKAAWVYEEDPRFMKRAFKNALIREKYMTEREFDAANGEPFVINMLNQGGRIGGYERISNEYFLEAPMTLILNLKVRKELKMTLEQIKKSEEAVKQALRTMNENTAYDRFCLVQADQTKKRIAAFKADMNQWRTRSMDLVKRELTPEQFSRYRQILFQQHLQRLHLPWALFAAGLPFDETIKLGVVQGDILGEANYRWQANQVQAGYKILEGLVGEQRAKAWCGELTLMPHIWALMNPERDKEVRRRLQPELFKKRKQINPRRKAK